MEASMVMNNIPVPDPQIPKLFNRLTLLWPIYFVLTLIAGIVLGIGGLLGYQEYASAPAVSTYEECVNSWSSRIQERYPSTCITRDGKRFTQPTMSDDDRVHPIYTDPLSCNTDNECTTGIQTNGCCTCPRPININEIGKNNWEPYISRKDYSNKSTCRTFMACAPCESPTTPVCRNNQCVFDNDRSESPPGSVFRLP